MCVDKYPPDHWKIPTKPFEVWKVVDSKCTSIIYSFRDAYGPGWNYATDWKGRVMMCSSRGMYYTTKHVKHLRGIHVSCRRAFAVSWAVFGDVIIKAIVRPEDVIVCDGRELAATKIYIDPETWKVLGLPDKGERKHDI